jgi:uncharacterized protein YeaO (DUF488 family)
MGSQPDVKLSRAYDPPGPGDGYRVLVDRLWPRGRTRDQLHIDAWERDLGPTTELRRWFGHDPGRWDGFQVRYRAELAAPEKARLLDDLAIRAGEGPLTIVYGARDTEHNQAQVVAAEIRQRLVKRVGAGP